MPKRSIERKDTEWRCDCGKWIPIGFSRHTHLTPAELTVEQMIHSRRLQELAMLGDADLLGSPTITHVFRDKRHALR